MPLMRIGLDEDVDRTRRDALDTGSLDDRSQGVLRNRCGSKEPGRLCFDFASVIVRLCSKRQAQ